MIPLICAGCGLSSVQEPTVVQRCCRVACNSCHSCSAKSMSKAEVLEWENRALRKRIEELEKSFEKGVQ